ncbi:MAG: hypothetical protein RI955_1456 [Bacteroidota bacterium]|jgi:hypothetical protein
MKNNFVKIFFGLLIFVVIFSCNENKTVEQKQEATPLENVVTNLPDSSGYQVFKSNCMICHSLRYIQMQPNFPEKTWVKIVDKMRKNFGAPIDSINAKIIVDYLVKVKGKK